MEIVGFNHDELTSGGYAPYTFVMRDLMANEKQMNTTYLNSNMFSSSYLYKELNETIYNAMPSDLRAAIKSANKRTAGGAQTPSLLTEPMKLWLLSYAEIGGTATSTKFMTNEGSRYSIFTGNQDWVKRLSNGTGNSANWWLRSPNITKLDSFGLVLGAMGAGTGDVKHDNGVCFGFCV